jgi:hypothetical protein
MESHSKIAAPADDYVPDIPDELLLKIFQDLLTSNYGAVHPHEHNTTFSFGPGAHGGGLLDIALTCKRFARVAQDLYYGENTFYIIKREWRFLLGGPTADWQMIPRTEVGVKCPGPTLGHFVRTLWLDIHEQIYFGQSLEEMLDGYNEWRFLFRDARNKSQEAAKNTEWQRHCPNLADLFITFRNWNSKEKPSISVAEAKRLFRRTLLHARVDVRAVDVSVMVHGCSKKFKAYHEVIEECILEKMSG